MLYVLHEYIVGYGVPKFVIFYITIISSGMSNAPSIKHTAYLS